MESRPVKTIPIHDHLRGKLCDLYENDCIFDKFECIWGGDDKCVYLYSYSLSICSFGPGDVTSFASVELIGLSSAGTC